MWGWGILLPEADLKAGEDILNEESGCLALLLARVSLSVPMETAPAALCGFSCSGKASEGEWLPHLPVALEELVVPISLWLT